jgi:hypothetical protein
VVARHGDNLPGPPRRQDSERIAFALDDERHRVDLGQAALRRLAGAPGRDEREREAEHGESACRFRRAAGDAGPDRAAADDQVQVGQGLSPQGLDGRRPDGVELWGAGREAAAGDAVGLLDQRNGDSLRPGRLRRRNEIRRLDSPPAPGPKTSPARGFLTGWRWARGPARRFELALSCPRR